MNLLPVAILGGAAYYLMRLRRNPQLAFDFDGSEEQRQTEIREQQRDELVEDSKRILQSVRNADERWKTDRSPTKLAFLKKMWRQINNNLDALRELINLYSRKPRWVGMSQYDILPIYKEVLKAYEAEEEKLRYEEIDKATAISTAKFNKEREIKEGINSLQYSLGTYVTNKERKAAAFAFMRSKGVRDMPTLNNFWRYSGWSGK